MSLHCLWAKQLLCILSWSVAIKVFLQSQTLFKTSFLPENELFSNLSFCPTFCFFSLRPAAAPDSKSHCRHIRKRNLSKKIVHPYTRSNHWSKKCCHGQFACVYAWQDFSVHENDHPRHRRGRPKLELCRVERILFLWVYNDLRKLGHVEISYENKQTNKQKTTENLLNFRLMNVNKILQTTLRCCSLQLKHNEQSQRYLGKFDNNFRQGDFLLPTNT